MPTTFPPPTFTSLPAGALPGSHTVDQPGWDGMRQATFTEWADRVGAAHNLGGYQDAFFNRYMSSRTGANVFLLAGAYNFSASQGVSVPDHLHYNVSVGGGSMTGGTPATCTISPVPYGVNATDVGHVLTINDGASTENVTITGGTAVAGSASGTLIFTPVHNHTGGAWTIGSSTVGLDEAKRDVPSDPTKLEGALLLSAGAPQYWHSGAWQPLNLTVAAPTPQDFSVAYNAGTLTFLLSGPASTLVVWRNGNLLRASIDYTFTPGLSVFTMLDAPSSSLDDSLLVLFWNQTSPTIPAVMIYAPAALTSAAIIASIATASAVGGGTVMLQSGIYLISSLVKVPSNVRLVGQGVGTILKLAANSWPSTGGASASPFWFANSSSNKLAVIAIADGASDVTLQDFVLDGNGANQTQTAAGNDIMGANCSDVTVSGVAVQNFKHPGTAMIDIGTANEGNKYLFNTIHGWGTAGLATGGIFSQSHGGVIGWNNSDGLGDASYIFNSQGVTGPVDGLIVGNTDDRGLCGVNTASISVEGCTSCKVRDNTVRGPANGGHYLVDETVVQMACSSIDFSGNVSEPNAAGAPPYSLVIKGDGNFAVQRISIGPGNEFTGATANLVYMVHATEVTVGPACFLHGAGGNAVNVDHDNLRVKVIGATISSSGGSGVLIGATNNPSTAVQDCDITSSASGTAIGDLSLTCLISGNRTDDAFNGVSQGFSLWSTQQLALANGANDNITTTIGATTPAQTKFTHVGMTGSYQTGGFANPTPGRAMIHTNASGQAWTIQNEHAGSTAVNRITTLTGADLTNVLSARFDYDPSVNRWIVTAHN
jgi:hypothetical protein